MSDAPIQRGGGGEGGAFRCRDRCVHTRGVRGTTSKGERWQTDGAGSIQEGLSGTISGMQNFRSENQGWPRSLVDEPMGGTHGEK